MNKRKLHHQYTKFRGYRAWPLLVISLVFLAVGIFGLRQNNFEMIRLRAAVIEADKENGDIHTALHNLREHVHGHMNTDLSSGDFAINPPIQLKGEYERLSKVESKRVAKANEAAQSKAEAICGRKHPGAGFNSPRVACIAEYMRVNAAAEKGVPSELYKFDFVSPRWSPDLAGLSLLASLVFFVLFVIRLLVGWWYKRLI